MKYFKDKNNSVYAYEADGSQDNFVLPDLIAITENEAILLANPPLSHDELVVLADVEKNQRLATAKDTIAPLSDAADFGDATDEEAEKLKQWKKYRLALTRTDTSTAPNIAWPEIPA